MSFTADIYSCNYNCHLQMTFTVAIYSYNYSCNIQTSITIVYYSCQLQSLITVVNKSCKLQLPFTVVIKHTLCRIACRSSSLLPCSSTWTPWSWPTWAPTCSSPKPPSAKLWLSAKKKNFKNIKNILFNLQTCYQKIIKTSFYHTFDPFLIICEFVCILFIQTLKSCFNWLLFKFF